MELYIREYVGMQQTTPHTRTKFWPSFLVTPVVTLYTKTYMQKASYLNFTVTFLASAKPYKSSFFFATCKNR